MKLSAAKMYFAFMVLGLTIFVGYLLAGGDLVPGSKSTVVINFSMWPDELEGCQVLIDGQTAGELKRFGNNFSTAFEVKDGDHLIEIAHPDYACEPISITAGSGFGSVMLVPDFETRYTADQDDEVYIALRL